MENVSRAIYLSFAMFALVLGLSFSMYLLNVVNATSKVVVQSADKTNQYQSVSFDSRGVLSRGNLGKIEEVLTTRTVTVDTIISTLYRYNQENFSIEIYEKEPKNLVQIFDIAVEEILRTKKGDATYNSYKSLYNNNICNLYDAPWVTDEEIKQRIDFYVSSKKGYIHGKMVDYENNGLSELVKKGSMFTERFIQYNYSGEVYTETNGDDTETLIGDERPLQRIIIQYYQQ